MAAVEQDWLLWSILDSSRIEWWPFLVCRWGSLRSRWLTTVALCNMEQYRQKKITMAICISKMQ